MSAENKDVNVNPSNPTPEEHPVNTKPQAADAAAAAPSPESPITPGFKFKQLPKSSRMLWVLILGMLAAFGPVCTDIYLPALPDLTQSFRTDPSVIQLSLTACFLGLALGQIVVGPISDAVGRRGPLVLSLIIFALSSFFCSLAPTVQILIVLRFFQGLAGAGGVVLCRSIACDMFMGNELTKFMALLMTVNSLAPILGPIAGSGIVSFFSWHWLFIFLSVWGILLLVGSIVCLRETLPREKRQSRLTRAVKDMFLQLFEKRFLCLALGMSMVMGGFFAYLAASPFVFQVIYGFSAVEYSFVFGFNALCITICALAAGRFERRLGGKFLVNLSFIVMIAASALMLFCAIAKPESPLLVIIALACFTAMIGSSQTPGFGIVMAARTKGAGAASGIFGIMGFVLGSLTSPLVGLMGDTSMLPLALCMIISAVFSYILFNVGIRLKKSE